VNGAARPLWTVPPAPDHVRMRRVILAVPALLTVAVLAACGGDKPVTTPAPGTSASAAAVAPAGTQPAAAGPTFSPEQQAYLTGLAMVEPALAADPRRALDRADNTCADLKAGEITGDKLADRVAVRLSGGAVQIDRAQAARAIELMRDTVC
jgi:predicted small lipoprotein YifL